MKKEMKRGDGMLPSRYSGTTRVSLHLRITGTMNLNLWRDKRLEGSMPDRIRWILERYLSRNFKDDEKCLSTRRR